MSHHHTAATPCPQAQSNSALPRPVGGNRRSSTFGTHHSQDETTTTLEIDYTRAMPATLKRVPPRRKSTFHRKAESQPNFTIFEDLLEEQELVVEPPKPQAQGKTLLGKPAQRIAARRPGPREVEKREEGASLKEYTQARRRSSLAPTAMEGFGDLGTGRKEPSSVLKKDPRRRTIFVPSEDTTIFTIHPGARSGVRLDDTFQLPPVAPASDGLMSSRETRQEHGELIIKAGKRPRLSLAGGPRRVPLQQTMTKNNVHAEDIAGKNGGKENVPPGGIAEFDMKKDVGHDGFNMDSSAHLHVQPCKSMVASKPRRSMAARSSMPPDMAQLKPIRDLTKHCDSSMQRKTALRNSELQRPLMERTRPVQQLSSSSVSTGAARKPSVHRRSVSFNLNNYPVLAEDLAQPELYEDNWLAQQEISLTEIINQIFTDAEQLRVHNEQPQKSPRQHMIKIYHREQVITLHKRLQASLLCGALSRPKELVDYPNPAADLGLRKRFISLWLNSYDEVSLRAGAEVVFGRQIPSKSTTSLSTNESVLDPLQQRRALTSFLEAFLVHCCDVEHSSDDPSGNEYQFQRWRKMVIRSVMLIWLLDQAKTCETIEGCLFLRESPRKSSTTVLQALAGMVIPSIGDITRSLRYLEYEVSHVQHPLDEVKYGVSNIAIDLRDGIFLARLVELLLFNEHRLHHETTTDSATITIQLPDLVILESMLRNHGSSEKSDVISQHLKLPCLGRAQKLYNVQLALSALHDHGRLISKADFNLTAEDIVDGHREKTLSLLWSLVGSYGLDQLVHWKALAVDTRRARTSSGLTLDESPEFTVEDSSHITQDRGESLLKAWAASHCARFGLRISNLTTSFADGRAYATLIHSFAGFLNLNTAAPGLMDLEQQLRSLGCSPSFAKQLVSSTHTIPSRRTTVSNLAFLASRLLPLAQRFTAAVTIQRTYRAHHQCIVAARRLQLKRVALACAEVVQTQSRLVLAATVLQRAWRGVVDSRIRRWNRDVTAFQALARRWRVRSKTIKSLDNARLDGIDLWALR